MVPAPFSFPLGVIRNSSKGSAVIMRETLIVILNGCEGSVAVVRESVRHHQHNRFFTLCHCPVSRLSHKVFLPLFRMTLNRRHSWDSNHFQAC